MRRRRRARRLGADRRASPASSSSGADFTAASPSPGNTFAPPPTSTPSPSRSARARRCAARSHSGHRELGPRHRQVQFQSSPAGRGLDRRVPGTPGAVHLQLEHGRRGRRQHDVRALAVDKAGYKRISAVWPRGVVDNTLPAVTLGDPGVMRAREPLTATASDSGQGLAALAIAYRAGRRLMDDALHGRRPRRASCNLEHHAARRGELRAAGRRDRVAGNHRDTLLTRTIDNTAPTMSGVPPAGALRGVADYTIERRRCRHRRRQRDRGVQADGRRCVVAGLHRHRRALGMHSASTPRRLPTASTRPRATAVDGAGHGTISASVTDIRIDNTAPRSATLTDPGTPLGGSEAIARHRRRRRLRDRLLDRCSTAHGRAGAWTDACSDTGAPYGCNWATAGMADGLYDLRAVAVDNAGNETVSATVTGRRVDNSPGGRARQPRDTDRRDQEPDGDGDRRSRRRVGDLPAQPGGCGQWTPICGDTTAAYRCSIDTTAVADGSYEVRVITVDAAGNRDSVSARMVDNPPRGADVQAGNGGATAGRLQPGDWIRLTWSEPIPRVGPERLDRRVAGDPRPVANSATQRPDGLPHSTGATRLQPRQQRDRSQAGRQLRQRRPSTFNATMVRRAATSITVTLGSRVSGTVQHGAAGHDDVAAVGERQRRGGQREHDHDGDRTGTVDSDF